jgi:hypothetical protein
VVPKLPSNKAKIWQALISFTSHNTYLQNQQAENDQALEVANQKVCRVNQVLTAVFPIISKIKHRFNL